MTLFVPPHDRIELSVAGIPHGRPRPRARAMRSKGGKWIAQVYHPKQPKALNMDDPGDRAWAKANAWFAALKAAAVGKMPPQPWTGAVWLAADVYFPRPERLLKKNSPPGRIPHTGRPDRDNLDKAILDALKEAGLVAEDSLVYSGGVSKYYVALGCGPGVRIRARHIVDGALDPSDVLRGVIRFLEQITSRENGTAYTGSLEMRERIEELRSIM